MRPETRRALEDVAAERARQDAKWGRQEHPDGTGGLVALLESDEAKAACVEEAETIPGGPTWLAILREEVAEVAAEKDRTRLRVELVQVAAVAAAWIEDLDRRESDELRRLQSEADRYRGRGP